MKKARIPAWDHAEYLFVRGLAGLINSLPFGVSTGMARTIGDLFYFVLPMRRKVALDNITLAFQDTLSSAEKKRIARESFRNLATSLMEFFRVPSMMKEAAARFEIEGTEHLDAAFAKGKGVIFIVSHLGSWEYLAFLFYLRNYPCTVIVRGANNPYIHDWIQTLRDKTHIKAIEREHAAKKTLRCLKQNELVSILIDQWAGYEGIWEDFFGKKTSTTAIPARFSRITGAALIPGYCLRTRPGYFKIVIQPEVLVDRSSADFERNATLELNRLLENQIHKFPEQWTWTHRRWKSLARYEKRGR